MAMRARYGVDDYLGSQSYITDQQFVCIRPPSPYIGIVLINGANVNGLFNGANVNGLFNDVNINDLPMICPMICQ